MLRLAWWQEAGYSLFTHMSSHIPALITTGLGVGMTTLSTIGLVRRKFSDPASPFMILAHGTVINAGVAVATGNFIGVANMLCAGLGQGLVGASAHHEQSLAPQPSTEALKQPEVMKEFKAAKRGMFFRNLEYIVDWPVRLMDRYSRPRRTMATPQ